MTRSFNFEKSGDDAIIAAKRGRKGSFGKASSLVQSHGGSVEMKRTAAGSRSSRASIASTTSKKASNSATNGNLIVGIKRIEFVLPAAAANKTSSSGFKTSPTLRRAWEDVASSSDDDDDQGDHKNAGASSFGARSRNLPATGNNEKAEDSVSVEDLGLPPLREQVFRRARVEKNLEWTSSRRIGPGLYNVGNTCFLNAALQCLSYLPPFVNMLLSKPALAGEKGYGVRTLRGGAFNAMKEMQAHLRLVHCPGRKGAVAPHRIVNNLRKIAKKLRVGRQEDAHEFVRHFVESLQKSCLREAGMKDNATGRLAETTLVHQTFGGYLDSHIKCREMGCGYVSRTYEPFLDLSIDIRRHGDTLEGALGRFTAAEELQGSNKWMCGGCNQKVSAFKGYAIKMAPSVLVVHFKRFSGTRSGKINSFVKFPATLDFSKYMSEKKKRSPQHAAHYQLCGVLVHSGGSMYSGHYTAIVRASSGAWYSMDDSSVSQVGINAVLRQKAYMLFYVRKASAAIGGGKQKAEKASPLAKGDVVEEDTGVLAAAGEDEIMLASAIKKSAGISEELSSGATVHKRLLFGDFLSPIASSVAEEEEEAKALQVVKPQPRLDPKVAESLFLRKMKRLMRPADKRYKKEISYVLDQRRLLKRLIAIGGIPWVHAAHRAACLNAVARVHSQKYTIAYKNAEEVARSSANAAAQELAEKQALLENSSKSKLSTHPFSSASSPTPSFAARKKKSIRSFAKGDERVVLAKGRGRKKSSGRANWLMSRKNAKRPRSTAFSSASGARYDSWDMELDRGRVKKVKIKEAYDNGGPSRGGSEKKHNRFDLVQKKRMRRIMKR